MEQENKMTISTFLANYLSKISIFILLGMGLCFYFIFRTFDMFPITWGIYLLSTIVGITLVFGLLCFLPKIHKAIKIVILILNILISIAFGVGSWYLPHIRADIEKAFAKIPTEGTAEINFYVLKNEYKNEPTGVTTPIHLKDYEEKTFILQQSTDIVNQDYAMLVANRELYSDGVQTIAVESIFDAVDALYAQTGDVMVLNSSYIPMIEDITGYEDFLEKVEIIYTVYKKLEISNDADTVDVTNKPFNVMIIGNDKWGDSVVTTGRTDVNLIASIHPKTKQVSFISIPRDGYVPNACLYNQNDKLTHAGIYGIKCTEETLENYLGIDIHYYVVINFSSLVKMIDAIDGIDVDNPYAFTTNSTNSYKGTFEKGKIHLTGKQALAYVRERKSLDNGDFARGEHQTLVMQAVIEKLTEVSTITHIDRILEALEGSFQTNFTIEELYALAQMQLNDMAIWDTHVFALTGTEGYETVASLDAVNSYSVVYLKDKQIAFVKNIMQQIHDGVIPQYEKMPE